MKSTMMYAHSNYWIFHHVEINLITLNQNSSVQLFLTEMMISHFCSKFELKLESEISKFHFTKYVSVQSIYFC